MIFFGNAILIALLVYGLWQKSKGMPLERHFFLSLVVKVAAGLAVGLIYQYYYGYGDTLVLFKDGEVLRHIAVADFSRYVEFLFSRDYYEPQDITALLSNNNPRAIRFAKYISAVNFLTNGNYWITSVYFSLFGFAGIWFCANMLAHTVKGASNAAAIAFFYFPSFVFWSSGILKESVLLGAIGGLTAILVPWVLGFREGKWKLSAPKVLLTIFLTYIIFKLKYYYLGGYLPAMMALALTTWLNGKFSFPEKRGMVLLVGIYFLVLFMSTKLHVNLQLENFLGVLVENTETMSRSTPNKENLIIYHDLSPSVVSILKNLPKAYLEGTFRPYIWEEGNWLKKVASIENILLAAVLVLAALRLTKFKVCDQYRFLMLSGLLYILLMTPLLAIAAPNIGTLARYKAGFSPFLLFIVLVELLPKTASKKILQEKTLSKV
ncbi:hypothetical protein V6R21_18150 [Limibacter armeniacum]|uniref:hypothetical protein n=1 Tax=Limibacter armeniacum TaxID=466084 RepID=UPI002FE5754B